MSSNYLFLCHPLLLLLLIFPSIKVFSSESAIHIKFPKYWSFSFSISSSNEYSRLISFSIDWFDLLALWSQGTLKILFQHQSLKATILGSSAFFMVQPSYLYMTPGKTITLTTFKANFKKKKKKESNLFFNSIQSHKLTYREKWPFTLKSHRSDRKYVKKVPLTMARTVLNLFLKNCVKYKHNTKWAWSMWRNI